MFVRTGMGGLPSKPGAAAWKKYDLAQLHNELWAGDPAYKFDSSINNSGVFATQSYTTLIQTGAYEFVVVSPTPKRSLPFG